MRGNGQYGYYNIDICLCIDKTGSMQPIIDTVRSNALNLYRDIVGALENNAENPKHVGRLRVRVIWFGDYIADGKNAMLGSQFLTLPEDEDKFRGYVMGVRADGGGDIPEDGLEALAFAMRSPWCKDGFKRRHIIALFTDAHPHPLGYSKSSKYYPQSMPTDFGALTAMWGDDANPGEMDSNAKRLLLFAPDTPRDSYWNKIAEYWDSVVMRPAEGDRGLQEVSYEAMLDTIVHSVN